MTEGEALEIARSVSEAQWWPFREPVSVVYRKRRFGRGGTWTIHTNISSMSGHVGITIDDRTRMIFEKRFVNLPR